MITFTSEVINCSGTDPSLSYCDVPMTVLRAAPFNLKQDDLVVFIVKAVNLIGQGLYSEPNTSGVLIQVEPHKMKAPVRGNLTSESQL